LPSTLKSGEEKSSTQKLHAVTGDSVRVADFNIKPGVTSHEGEGGDWPSLRARILGADILVVGKRVLERMDAFLNETDDQKRMRSFGKVAVVGVVGNEDGAHHCHAELYQVPI
jgi:hypothetical protein